MYLAHDDSIISVQRPSFLCSLVLRFVKDQFDDYRESTIGGAFADFFACISRLLMVTSVQLLS